MANQILEILGLQHLSPPEQECALQKIVADSFVLKKASDLAIRQHIVATINSLLPIERAALLKRIGAGGPHQQLNHVSWSVGEGLYSGRLHVLAQCSHGNSLWDSPAKKLGNVKHCNSQIPSNVLDEYLRRWVPVNLYSAAEGELLGRNALPSSSVPK